MCRRAERHPCVAVTYSAEPAWCPRGALWSVVDSIRVAPVCQLQWYCRILLRTLYGVPVASVWLKINLMALVQTICASTRVVYGCCTICGTRNAVPKTYGIHAYVAGGVRWYLCHVYDTLGLFNSVLQAPGVRTAREGRHDARRRPRHSSSRCEILQIFPNVWPVRTPYPESVDMWHCLDIAVTQIPGPPC